MALPNDFYLTLLQVGANVGPAESAQTVQSDINSLVAAAVVGGVQVINKTGGTLAKGKAVAIAGFDTTSGFFKIAAADASAVHAAIGVLPAAVLDGGTTTLYTSQAYDVTASGLDTSGAAVGDPVYLGTSGALTLTAPAQGSGSLVQVLGSVKSAAVSGNLHIFAMAPTPPVLSASNAHSGLATAAQITALEGLQKGLPTVETVTGSTALSLSAGVSFLNPSGTATYTLAAGANGQEKLIVLLSTHAVTVTEIPGWTGGTAGDYVRVVYSTVAGAWLRIGQYTD